MPSLSLDTFFMFAGFLLTVFIWSYLVGDNPLYRIALHFFVGATAGYVVIVVTLNVLIPQLFTALLGEFDPFRLAALGGAWLLALLLFFRLFASNLFTRLPVAFLVGVGAAVAVGGALTGTLVPQVEASFLPLIPTAASPTQDALETFGTFLIVVVGVVGTLAFFHYGGRTLPGGRVDRPLLVKPFAWVGQIFIGAALGVMYAGALAASFAFLAERVAVIWLLFKPYLGA